MWQLVINGPGYFDTPYPLPEGTTSLGRAEDNDIVLSGDLVSRRHARLHLRDGGIQVEDLGSRNGSKLNGEAFTGTIPLSPGDLLLIGDNALAVRRPGPAEHAPTGELAELELDGRLILSRSIRESQVLLALGNVPQRMGAPGRVPSPADFAEAPPPVPYETLLMLYQVAESLPRATSLENFLAATCDALVAHVGASTAAVLLRQADGQLSVELARKSGGGAEVPVSRAIVEDALESGSALVVEEASRDLRFAARESVVRAGPGMVVCVPLGTEAPHLGALYLQGPFRVEAPAERLADVATAVAHLLSAAVMRFEAAGPEASGLPVMSLATRLGAEGRTETLIAGLHQERGGRGLREQPVAILQVDLAGASVGLPPEVAAEVLHALHVYLLRVVRGHGGVVEGSEGERLRVLFLREGDAATESVAAVRAAMELRGVWEEVTLERPPTERCPLRAAVASGPARLAEVGPVDRPALLVLGDVAPLAQALLQESAPGQVLIDGRTLAGVGVRFEVQPLGERGLGVARAAVFEVLEEDQTDPGQSR